MMDADHPASAFKVFSPRYKDVLYDVMPIDVKLLILTNWNSKNFRLMECPLDKTSKENWKEVIPHRTDVLLESAEEFKYFMVLIERKNGLTEMHVLKKDGTDYYIKFDEPAYDAGVGTNPEYNSTALRYFYTSLTTPNSTYDYNLEKKDQKLMKQ